MCMKAKGIDLFHINLKVSSGLQFPQLDLFKHLKVH